jgi:VWFA-related protein
LGSSEAGNVQQEAPFFKAEANLILTRFHVIHDREYSERIKASDIELKQDGKVQEIAFFEGPSTGPRTQPLEIALLLDVSYSVTRRGLFDGSTLQKTLLAPLGENTEISIWAFAEHLKKFCEPTRDPEVLSRSLSQSYNFEHLYTHLYEAIVETCQQMGEGDPNKRRAMIIFSDGFETGSSDARDAYRASRDADISLFPVILGHDRILEGARYSQRRLPDRQNPGRGVISGDPFEDRERRQEIFAELGEDTGGRSFDPKQLSFKAIEVILGLAVQTLRSEYVVGYYLDPSLKKGKHKVKVQLRSKSFGKLRGGEREFRN